LKQKIIHQTNVFMFFSKLSKQKSVLGVDVGTAYIKIAQITHTEHKPLLDTYGMVDISNYLEAGNKDRAVAQTAAVLKNLMNVARVTTKRCVASLPNSAVFTSVIDMPLMSDTELASAMPYEAKKYVPLPLSEVALSWSIVTKNEAAKTLKVLLIAVPITVRESYVQLFSMAALNLEIIEIEALALIRSLTAEQNNNCLIIDIGARSTGLNIIKDGLLQLTRNLNVGGDTITDKIAQSLGINKIRAEQFKKDFGMSKSNFIPESVKPVLQVVKGEALQLINLYRSHNLTLSRIMLVGGSAKLPGISDYFADLGIPVELGDPLRELSFPESAANAVERYKSQLSIAVGLGLRNS
jgi:type IV pilus assembly protein PilM